MKTSKTLSSFPIGLFGGTFNPIHFGHRQAALDVLAQFNLNCIHFIPSALPPHKSGGMLASAADRLEMVRLAIGDHPRLIANDVELRRAGPSYTIDTLRHFKAETRSDKGLYFILGIDAFLEINVWKSYTDLLREAAFIVMPRPGAVSKHKDVTATVASFVRDHIGEGFQWNPSGNALVHPDFQAIHLARISPVDIASSQIRQMVHQGLDISAWVPPAVARYIHEKDLYQ